MQGLSGEDQTWNEFWSISLSNINLNTRASVSEDPCSAFIEVNTENRTTTDPMQPIERLHCCFMVVTLCFQKTQTGQFQDSGIYCLQHNVIYHSQKHYIDAVYVFHSDSLPQIVACSFLYSVMLKVVL